MSDNDMQLADVNVAVIGLGYVGLPLAVEIGARYPTTGFDVNASRITELQLGHDRTLEVENADFCRAYHLRFLLVVKRVFSQHEVTARW